MRIVIILTILLNVLSVNGQPELPVTTRQVTNSSFVDCYAYKNGIVALDKGGKVYEISFDSVTVKEIPGISSGVAAIGVDRKGKLWAADSVYSIYTRSTNGFVTERYVMSKVWDFVFDNHNTMLLFTDLGIYNSQTEMYYGINNYHHRRPSEFARTRFHPSLFTMDDFNNLWMYYRSRRGDEIYTFSIDKGKFIYNDSSVKRRHAPYSSLFAGDGKVFYSDRESYGLNALYNITPDSVIRLNHPEYDTLRVFPPGWQEEYFGAAFFDAPQHAIYYYSNLGLYKVPYDRTKNKLGQKKLIMPSQCEWTGYDLEELQFIWGLNKMFKSGDRIVYLHRNGIYVIDRNRLLNFK